MTARSGSGGPGTSTIPARRWWTRTGIMLREGHVYRITAQGCWKDKTTPCGPDGYTSKKLVLRLARPLRRKCRAPWFALIGAQRFLFARRFIIGREVTYRAPRDGPLACFANDVWFMYWNNKCSVEVTVEELTGS